MGSSVLMFGAGPTGLVLAQLLRVNGGCHVVVAAPEGLKMELAKKLGAGDVYVELSRKDPSAQFQKLKSENPYGKQTSPSLYLSYHVTTPLVCEVVSRSGALSCTYVRSLHAGFLLS